MKRVLWILLPVFIIVHGSCSKLVEVAPPVTKLTKDKVYATDIAAISVVASIYSGMSDYFLDFAGNIGTLNLYASLYTDELSYFKDPLINSNVVAFYTNKLTSTTFGSEYWAVAYGQIFNCNAALDGISNAQSLTPSVKKQLLGELKFLRAFFYYHIVNLYGDAPWVTTTDYSVNSQVARTPAIDVLRNIRNDLREARELLSDQFLDGTLLKPAIKNRYRVSTHAAAALLAKVCLMTGDWTEAETAAGDLIANTALFKLDTLNGCFLTNTPEAIWQLQTVRSYTPLEDANRFIMPAEGPSNSYPFFISSMLLNSFETGDQRKAKWIDTVRADNKLYYFPFKYKSKEASADPKEALTIFRLADIFLCRAEARMQQDKLQDAIDDINQVRHRAGLIDLTSMGKAALKDAILKERQVEMFTEFGARFYDMKRLGKIDDLMPAICQAKGITWDPDKALFPLSAIDIDRNKNLIQNKGY
ncbi:MAG: RagB/SusD family nutrient uptake outer membrane protein [Chitinophagaceae bacterium]|nr:RagB/SusD family nutrient uptake outer membrane protein [Chitinophagaceae bacterium]